MDISMDPQLQALHLSVCIPTYRRTSLLQRLLEDISLQTVHPRVLVIIDGDPTSGEVLRMLTDALLPKKWRIIYVPSNHANAPFQRYLGWRAASEAGGDVLLYFDDDLRLHLPNALAKVIAPFGWGESDILGVTAEVEVGDLSQMPGTEALRSHHCRLLSVLVRLFGSSIPPGGLTPVGNRRLPIRDSRNEYTMVQWLRGGVMAYRMKAVDQTRFSKDAFAMAHIRCGLGVDDTVLSRAICSNGKMLVAFETGIEHPHDDLPKAYPYRARNLAYATAYSRRFINDHYRSPASPTVLDRLALLRNYLGVTAFAWFQAIISFKTYRLVYAIGYTQGAIRGLIQTPTAENLTPNIDWWSDSEKALASAVTIQRGAGDANR